ncbi:MAG: permease [Parcubacteria group bacterium]|nr:permease [Parcubacteria group bacterium]
MFQHISNFITYTLLSLSEESKLAITLNYFIYSFTKILLLIFVVVFVVSFFRTFFPTSKIKKIISKARFGSGNLIASIFGSITPFCSCSSIPLFIGFIKAGIPSGIAFSFLITSPLVNEIAFVLMGELFGWKLAFAYAFTGIMLGVVAGLILGALRMDDQIVLDRKEKEIENLPKDFKGKLSYSYKESKKTFKSLFLYVLGGLLLGAIIHGYVPQDFFADYISKYNILAVPIAALVGIPIYAGCSTVVPIIFGITANGVPLGTSLAFMMSIAGLSLPEGIILKKIIRGKLLAIFFTIVGFGIILIGYLFNFLEKII